MNNVAQLNMAYMNASSNANAALICLWQRGNNCESAQKVYNEFLAEQQRIDAQLKQLEKKSA